MSAATRFGASEVQRCEPIQNELQGRGIVLERQRAKLIERCPVCEHCSICNCAPCGTPGFCQMCREVDRKAAAQRRRKHDPPQGWDNMSLGALWERLNDPRRTDRTNIEAIMVAVRIRGLAALKEPANIERLGRCDAQARAEINRRIANQWGTENA
jgi:hypothetical protein